MKAVAYCGTRNVYEDMVTAAKSLLSHNKIDKIYFIIEDNEFPYPLPDIFECINISDQQFFLPNSPNYQNSWTYMVLMRAVLSKILPEDLDFVLSLDIDTIVNSDISSLWENDMENFYFAAAVEPYKTTGSYLYTNFGVSFHNLKKLRKDGKVDEIIRLLNFRKLGASEQDAFNLCCQGHIRILPGDYNKSSFTTKVWTEEKITHFAGIPTATWREYDIVKEYRNKSFEEILC